MSKTYIWTLPALLGMITFGLLIAVADAALAPNDGPPVLLAAAALFSILVTTASIVVANLIIEKQKAETSSEQSCFEPQREHLVCADDLAELNAIEQAVLAEQNTPIQCPHAISERPYDYEKDGL